MTNEIETILRMQKDENLVFKLIIDRNEFQIKNLEIKNESPLKIYTCHFSLSQFFDKEIQ